jgi:hypothetical protein
MTMLAEKMVSMWCTCWKMVVTVVEHETLERHHHMEFPCRPPIPGSLTLETDSDMHDKSGRTSRISHAVHHLRVALRWGKCGPWHVVHQLAFGDLQCARRTTLCQLSSPYHDSHRLHPRIDFLALWYFRVLQREPSRLCYALVVQFAHDVVRRVLALPRKLGNIDITPRAPRQCTATTALDATPTSETTYHILCHSLQKLFML